MMGLIQHGVKAVYSFRSHEWVYYDLRTDPVERTPLAHEPRPAEIPMRFALTTWYAELDKYKAKKAAPGLSKEDIEQLKSLGYIR